MIQQASTDEVYFSLSTMPNEVNRVLQLFPFTSLNWIPGTWDGIPGEKFSAIEQICHLRDIETDGYHKRIQAILSETNPVLTSIEGYELSIHRNYKNADLNETISAFQMAREKTIELIMNLEDSQWDRIGFFEGYGTVTLRALIHFLCSHDLEHLASLRWLLGKLEGQKVN